MNHGKPSTTSSAVDMLARARALMKQRNSAEGLEAYRELTTRYPNYVEGWFERSGVENSLGNAFTAIDVEKQAVRLAPDSALHRAQLAQLQVSYGLWGDALETLAPLLQKKPDSYEARVTNAIGAVLSLAGLELEAQPWFEAAAKAAADQQNYRFNAAQGLTHCGKLDQSASALESTLRSFPDFAKAHWALSSLVAKRADEKRVATLRQALARAASPNDEVYYCFALFNLLDGMGRTREAFAELEHGMKLQRAVMRYAGEDIALLRRIGRIGAEFCSSPPKSDGQNEQAIAARPIFIVGLPRSGTTVVERILSNHPDVAQGGEFICFSAALRERFGIETPGFVPTQLVDVLATDSDLAGIGERYLQLTAFKHQGHSFFTDKLPFNFMLLPWIARALPHARFVHVQRDAMDTCFSNLKQLFSRHFGACYSQRDMAEYYLAYHELMQTWDTLLPGRILQVRYKNLVDDPEGVSARMLDFCGLAPHSDAWRIEQNVKPVATASAAQVRDPIDKRGIGAWRRYEAELGVLTDFFRNHPELAN